MHQKFLPYNTKSQEKKNPANISFLRTKTPNVFEICKTSNSRLALFSCCSRLDHSLITTVAASFAVCDDFTRPTVTTKPTPLLFQSSSNHPRRSKEGDFRENERTFSRISHHAPNDVSVLQGSG